MKKTIISLILLLALMVGVATVGAAPRMVLPESEFNFGYVPQNSKVSHVFWLHSEGDDDLRIIKVVPG